MNTSTALRPSPDSHAHPQLPARYDHVGSFLRPDYLLAARAQHTKGEIDADQLREVEDRAVAEIVRFQQDVGMQAITDGEYRRATFHIDFLDQLGGVETSDPIIIEKPDGTRALSPPVIRVAGKVRHARNIEVDNYRYLQSQLAPGSIAKVAIPSPTMLHFRGGRAGISREAYPELEPVFYDDVARAFGEELRALHAAGCRYVQLDDTNLAYLCDPKLREAARTRGDDPDELPRRYAGFINKLVAYKPADMLLALHLCRGNFRSTFAASGDYEPVAEALLSGLITTKVGVMEDPDALKRRIDEAARYAPLEQLALSPQCGFASSAEGNDISWDNQRRKLEMVVKIAREVWGDR
jgi:5-methyltetrahydropteroyltriglutamate--homocysteine methyltransferase